MTAFQKRSFYGDPTYNPFERPSMPLASLALDGVLGGGSHNDSGQQVDALRGIALPTVYRCISVLSTVVASCTLEEIDKTGAAEVWDVFQNLQSYTAFEISELIVTHMAGWGNFYARKVMMGSRLIDLQPIYPGNVSVRRVRGQKIFRVRKMIDATDASPNATQVGGPNSAPSYEDLTEDDVFHIPFLGYDGLQGMSPIMAAQQTVGIALASDRLAARFYRSGQQLGGIVKVKVPLAEQSQADAIKMQWQAVNGGVNNAGGVTVLDSETDFQPITIAPDSLQFIESRTWNAQELARIYGVPLTMLSFASTGYGDAIETQQIGFVSYTVRSYTDRIEQRLSREFTPRGRSVKYNLDQLMRGTLGERYTAYNLAIAGGWMQPAEARASENMTDESDLDYFLKPQALNGVLNTPPMTPNGAPPPGAALPPTAPSDPDDAPDDADDDNEDSD